MATTAIRFRSIGETAPEQIERLKQALELAIGRIVLAGGENARHSHEQAQSVDTMLSPAYVYARVTVDP